MCLLHWKFLEYRIPFNFVLFVSTFYFEIIIGSQEVAPSAFLFSALKAEIGATVVSLWVISSPQI